MADVYRRRDGSIVYRASALGGCDLSLLAARLGFDATPFPPSTLQLMEEGNLHEPDILRRVGEQEGMVISQPQGEVAIDILPGVLILGHVDAIGEADGRQTVIEAKAMGKATFEDWMRNGWSSFRRYAFQLSCYMHATGYPGIMAVKNRDTGILHVSHYPQLPIAAAEIKLKVARIEAAATERKLSLGCDAGWCMCGFRYLRRQPSKLVSSAVDADDPALVDELGSAYDALVEEEKALKERKDALAERIHDLTGDEIIDGDGDEAIHTSVLIHGTTHWVRWGSRSTSSLMKDELTADLPEGKKLADYYRKARSKPFPTIGRLGPDGEPAK